MTTRLVATAEEEEEEVDHNVKWTKVAVERRRE